jgi:hypothetical protein
MDDCFGSKGTPSEPVETLQSTIQQISFWHSALRPSGIPLPFLRSESPDDRSVERSDFGNHL